MKLLIVFSVTAWMLAAADGPSKPEAHKAAAPLTIPARAVKGDDGSYRYTDRQGKKWIYRKTPFGIARVEDKPVDEAAEMARFENVKAVEDGDTIRFERPGPFGVYRWQRKKSELDETEQAVWDREQARAAAGRD
ncbi:MAG TPA: hypothetical protein VMH81_16165 [Bryobacteraceae bacterium]|nr:hypothetical protein [Bryobacteraceae bacterium]